MITNTEGGGHSSLLMDAIGRTLESHVTTFDGHNAATFTQYDGRGRVLKTSRPTLTGATPLYTTYTYDDRDRVTAVTEPNTAKIRRTYVELRTETVDPRGNRTGTAENVDGEIATSVDAAGSITTFEYGPFGQPTKTTAVDRSIETVHYDTLGRPDRQVDPSSGTTVTTYDAFGEPATVTNGAEEKTTLSYDELGRVKTTTSPDGTATNTYDTAANGIGKLASAKSADGVVTGYAYDSFGHTKSATWTIEGVAYAVDYGYDEFGLQQSLTYPDIPGPAGRMRLDYAYNSRGYLQSVKNPTEPKPYWQASGRNAEGALTGEQFGNDVTGSYTYEASTGRLTGTNVTGPGGDLQKLDLGYDLNGNLTHRADAVTGRQEDYAPYDVLNRLIRWRVQDEGKDLATSYTYNEIGNLKTETTTGHPEADVTYRYGENDEPPHALTSRNTSHYAYDSAGRQTSGTSSHHRLQPT